MSILVKVVGIMVLISYAECRQKNLRASPRTELTIPDASDPDDQTLAAYIATVLIMSITVLILYVKFAIPPNLALGRSLPSHGFWSDGVDLGDIARTLNSIDPMESAFAWLKVDERVCKERAVCELQKATSTLPLVNTVLGYIRPSIPGLIDYKKAQDAGAALEDCALLFSECPYSLLY